MTIGCVFQLKHTVWLFMELMDTCIETLLKRTGPIPEPIIGTILVSVCDFVCTSKWNVAVSESSPIKDYQGS